jgi:uncharacterized membrane protein
MEIVDPGLAMMLLILGLFLVILGIVISGVVYRESREWRRLIMPMFDSGCTPTAPESADRSRGMTQEQVALRKQIFARIFRHMDVAGLLGGSAAVIVGILIVLIGLALYS